MTEIMNGSKKEVHLCEECVEKDFILPYFRMSIEELFKKISTGNPVFPMQPQQPATRRTKPNPKRCWACGCEFSEFNIFSELGCSNEYQLFAKQIDKILKDNNNNLSVHSGKLPLRSLETTRKYNRSLLLHTRMENAVRAENYELAAAIRDEIKHL